jgi:uncharacterized protein (DUF58 family)
MPLFDADFLTKLENLSLASRRIVRGQLMAQRRTRRMGGGVEFAEHREYVSGDDFRYLDWNLFARHDELLLKRFQEEEDLHVYLLLDCSRSMAVGDSAKFDLARRVVAALAYIALADLDRVSICAFADGVLQEFPLTRGKARILRLMEFLEQLQANGPATALSALAREFAVRPQKRGLAIVVSDFFDPAGFEKGLDILRHHNYEAHVVQIHLKSEAIPTVLGDVEFVDVESDDVRSLIVTETHLEKYRMAFEQFLQRIRTYCATCGMACIVSTTDRTFDELILEMMRKTRTS